MYIKKIILLLICFVIGAVFFFKESEVEGPTVSEVTETHRTEQPGEYLEVPKVIDFGNLKLEVVSNFSYNFHNKKLTPVEDVEVRLNEIIRSVVIVKKESVGEIVVKKNGFYSIRAPFGEYQLEVSGKGVKPIVKSVFFDSKDKEEKIELKLKYCEVVGKVSTTTNEKLEGIIVLYNNNGTFKNRELPIEGGIIGNSMIGTAPSGGIIVNENVAGGKRFRIKVPGYDGGKIHLTFHSTKYNKQFYLGTPKFSYRGETIEENHTIDVVGLLKRIVTKAPEYIRLVGGGDVSTGLATVHDSLTLDQGIAEFTQSENENERVHTVNKVIWHEAKLTIVDEDGKPVSDCTLWRDLPTKDGKYGICQYKRSNASGIIKLRYADPGTAVFQIKAEGFENRDVTLSHEATITETIFLKKK